MNTITAQQRTRHFFATREFLPSTMKEQIKHNGNAGILMVSMSCLNSFLIDLEDDLREAGLFRHQVKHNFNRISSMVEKITNSFYGGAKRVKGGEFVRDYNEDVENATVAINKAVLLQGVERSYNIVLSLIRICLDSNNKIGRFRRDFVDGLIPTISWLQSAKIKDYNIDFIVRNAIENI